MLDYSNGSNDIFNCLPLTIHGGSVIQCMEVEFNTKEKIECNCDKCHSKTKTKVTKIAKSPKTLIIQLKRFLNINETGETYKIHQQVSFEEKLSLNKWTDSNIRSYDYQLCGIILHDGENTNSGHYTAIYKKMDDWVLFNDEIVTTGLKFNEIKSNKLHQANVYVLLYTRI